MPPNPDDVDVLPLHPSSCLGFSGGVLGGLHAVTHGGEPFVAFPLGAMVVVKHATRRDGVAFLRGHTREVSCVAVSHDGARLASGQSSLLGVDAPVLVWDLEAACARALAGGGGAQAPLLTLRQHLSGVRALAFSCDDAHLASVGARDDNTLVVWSMASGAATAGAYVPLPVAVGGTDALSVLSSTCATLEESLGPEVRSSSFWLIFRGHFEGCRVVYWSCGAGSGLLSISRCGQTP